MDWIAAMLSETALIITHQRTGSTSLQLNFRSLDCGKGLKTNFEAVNYCQAEELLEPKPKLWATHEEKFNKHKVLENGSSDLLRTEHLKNTHAWAS